MIGSRRHAPGRLGSRGARATLRPPARPDQGKLRYARPPRLLTAAWPSLSGSALLALVLAGCARTEGQSRGDYLDPELRSSVEALKAAVAAAPTTAENAPDHSATLWKWANALRARRRRHSDRRAIERATGDARRPGEASGAGRAAPEARPLRARARSSRRRSPTRWARCVRERGADRGRELHHGRGDLHRRRAGARAGRHPLDRPPDHARSGRGAARGSGRGPLRVDPLARTRARAGRSCAFRSVACTRRGSRTSPTSRSSSRQGRVEPGETVTVTVRRQAAAARAASACRPSAPTSCCCRSTSISRATGSSCRCDWPGLTVIGPAGGGGGARLRAVDRGAGRAVPALGAQRGPLVESQQRTRSPPTTCCSTASRGASSRPASAPCSSIADAQIDQPGIHRFTVKSSDGKVTATSNPVWVREDASRRVYWGETHGHCGFGEGQGSPTSLLRVRSRRLPARLPHRHRARRPHRRRRVEKARPARAEVQRRREVRHLPRLRVVGAATAGRPSQRDLPRARAPSHRAPGVPGAAACSTRACARRTTSTTCSSSRTPTTPATGRATTRSSRSWSRCRRSTAPSSGSATSTSRAASRSASSAAPTTIAPTPACRSRCRGRS